MQRSAWLAVGAVTGALALQTGTPPLLALAGAALAGATASAIARCRPAAAALAAGVTLILLRGLIGAVAVAPAGSDIAPDRGSHEAIVLSIGTPGDGLQRAVLELRPPDASQHVYAWLPRYPHVF